MATYSDTFLRAIKITLQNEGGYVNNPKDPGGETNFGISKRSYPTLDIKNLTKDDATAIYYRDWWSTHPFEQMTSADLACKVFDTCVNLGVSRGVKFLQRCLQANGHPEVTDDGNFGPHTLVVTNSMDGPSLLAVYRTTQANYYKALVAAKPDLQQFLKGWLNRAAQ
jgi:lysozyme family protein